MNKNIKVSLCMVVLAVLLVGCTNLRQEAIEKTLEHKQNQNISDFQECREFCMKQNWNTFFGKMGFNNWECYDLCE